MNRREALTAGGMGVAGLLLPQKVVEAASVEAKAVGPMLLGATDEGMATILSVFPQENCSLRGLWRWNKKPKPSERFGIELREDRMVLQDVSVFHIEGTVICSGNLAAVGRNIDIKSLELIRLVWKKDSSCEYRRMVTATGPGWFVGQSFS